MDVLKLLDNLEDIIEDSSSIPFSGRILLDREDIIELIKDIRIQLPDEVKQAQWIKEERNKILVDAQQEAEVIVSNARKHIEELVEKDRIVELANKKANDIINNAENHAKDIKLASTQYADEILKKIESDLLEIKETVEKNRDELKDYNPY